ncbi:hypothetical protein N9165_02370 [Akkermansiaceae bacterium]|nr:hypothetical protein [Akkermansiaceae bacterium]MDB4507951.1 hypothetical protein [Akkermansiaceae bacterium]
MKKAANVDSYFTYLDDKDWTLFRPTREIDHKRLHDFVEIVLIKVSHPKKSFDYSGTLGISNRSVTPKNAL